MAQFDENFIKITEYEVLGKLPDPFLKPDGTRVKTAEEFNEHKKELYKTAVELQYGTQPPKPEFLDVELLHGGKGWRSSHYRITTGKKDKPISFLMRVYVPVTKEKCPVIITGDLCFDYFRTDEYLEYLLNRNIGFVTFNRLELANDVWQQTGKIGPLFDLYPEYTFGAIGAWAWGYSRCIDALEKLDLFDLSCIAFTGHSRGGKTAMLAGALDERAAIVNPNATCQGACSCYRIHMKAITEGGIEKESERLKDLVTRFDFWMGEGLNDYMDCEEKLPFDSHYLKALVAPRTLFISEAASDIWANPIGSWMTTMAAKEVFKLYGKEDNVYWYFRKGYHFHKPEDIHMLANVIKHKTEGEPLSDNFFVTPFKQPELIYDWRCPEK